jgi:hypothetical protein
MYRERQYGQVFYGRFNDFLKLWEELNAIARKRHWPEWTIWVPTVGASNDVIVEREFPDLASYAKASDAFQSDPETMKVYRSGSSLVVQGSVRNELLEEVTKPLA